MIQKPIGTNDILPAQCRKWQYVEEIARKTAAKYGFSEIRFPTFEATELFRRGVGDTTDVVQKEMYTFEDRDTGRSLTLRPEGTASIARSVIENGLYAETMPLKLCYIINCFRHEKPQAGRYREFFQFGVEMFGAQNAAADAQVIALGAAVLKNLGLKFKLRLNSIGCPECRPKYHAALKEYFAAHTDELCDTCKGRLSTNPLRILDCKNKECAELAENAPKTVEHLCDDCRKHYAELHDYLDAMGIEYIDDPKIVRGLDYYTRTVFEFQFDGIGSQNALGGGGRYDNLIESVGGNPLCGIGFAMGINRLLLAMDESGVEFPEIARPALYIASLGADASVWAMKTVEALRNAGIYAECDTVGRSLKAQMKYANKLGAAYTLMIGDNEIATGKASLRNMSESTQSEIELDKLIDTIKAL